MIDQLVQQLIDQALAVQLIEQEDQIYARNQILSLLELTEFKEVEFAERSSLGIPDLLEEIVNYACQQSVIEDIFDEKEVFSSKIMNCLMARPLNGESILF
ncbi:galactose-1-phosphate uridylyltransferase [Bacillus sp. SLBN-46]|nr:galactose-1-phosphate uridylyltransferase [Bacillus sp. SLBN-46]